MVEQQREQRLVWRCYCGNVQIHIQGQPLFSLVCHCHSCVAGSRFIDDKRTTAAAAAAGTESSSASSGQEQGDKYPTSSSQTALLHQGTAVCAFRSHQVQLPDSWINNNEHDGIQQQQLRFIKIGSHGKPGRCYTTCCYTQVTNVTFPNFMVITSNFLYHASEDNTPYQVVDPPHVNLIHSFEQDNKDEVMATIPQAQLYQRVPLSIVATFLRLLLFPFLDSNPFTSQALLNPSSDYVEQVPITW